jgi:hypothetical protein
MLEETVKVKRTEVVTLQRVERARRGIGVKRKRGRFQISEIVGM